MAINTTKQKEINEFLTGKTSKDTKSTDDIKSLTDRFSNLSNKETLKSDYSANIISNKMRGSDGTSNNKFDNSSLDTKKNFTNDSIKRVLSSFSTKNTSNYRENQNHENLEIREIREKEKVENYNRESKMVLLEDNTLNDNENFNELLAKAQDSYNENNTYKAKNFSDININTQTSNNNTYNTNNNTNSNSSTYNITTSYNKRIKSTNSIDNIKFDKNIGYELNSYRAINEDLSNKNDLNSSKSKRVSSNHLINSKDMLNKINIDYKDESYNDNTEFNNYNDDLVNKKSDFLNNSNNSNNSNDDLSDIKNESYYEFPRISKNNIIKQILIENDLYEDKKNMEASDTHLHLNNNDYYQKNINKEINTDDIYDINDSNSNEINDIYDLKDHNFFSPLLINSYKDLNNIDNLNINNKFSPNSNNNENINPNNITNNRRISYTNNFNNMRFMNNNTTTNNANNANTDNNNNLWIYKSNTNSNGNQENSRILNNNNKIAFINTNDNGNMTLTNSTDNKGFLLNNYYNRNTNPVINNNLIQGTINRTFNKNQVVYRNVNVPYNPMSNINNNQSYKNNNAYININSNFIQNYNTNINSTNNANSVNNAMISNINRLNTNTNSNTSNINNTTPYNYYLNNTFQNTNNINHTNNTNNFNIKNNLNNSNYVNNFNYTNNISSNNFITSSSNPYITNINGINNNLILSSKNDNYANSIKSINMSNRILNYNHSIPTSSPTPIAIHPSNQSNPNNTNITVSTVNTTTNTLNTKNNTNYDTDPNLQLDIKDLEKIESLCSCPSNKLLNMCFSYKPSRMIQALIEKIKATPKASNIPIVSKFIKTMISISPMLIENEYSSFIYQKLIYLFTAKERISFWRTYKTAINQLCSHNIASYCVQDLILLIDNNKEEDLVVSNFVNSDLIQISKENFSYLIIIKLTISLESRYKITKKASNLINLFNLILSNLDELYNDMYGIHVIHHIVISISNLVNMSNSNIINSNAFNVSDGKDFTSLKHKFISKIIKHLKLLLNSKYGVHCINNILEYLDNNVILFIANKITKHFDDYITGEYFNIFLFKYITNITRLNLLHVIIPNFFSAIIDYNNVLESLLGKKNIRLLLDSLTIDQIYYLKSHFSIMLKNQTQFPSILPLKELMIYYNIPNQINKNLNEDYLSNILINSQNTNISIDSNISINIRNIKYINKMLDSAMCIKLSNIAQTNNKIA